jgi:hypothetical protein
MSGKSPVFSAGYDQSKIDAKSECPISNKEPQNVEGRNAAHFIFAIAQRHCPSLFDIRHWIFCVFDLYLSRLEAAPTSKYRSIDFRLWAIDLRL